MFRVWNGVVMWPRGDFWFYNLKICTLTNKAWGAFTVVGTLHSLMLMFTGVSAHLCSFFWSSLVLTGNCCRAALGRTLLPRSRMLLFHLFLSSQAGIPHSFFRGARSHLEPGNFCSALRVTIHKDFTALNYSTHKEHFFSSDYKMLQ